MNDSMVMGMQIKILIHLNGNHLGTSDDSYGRFTKYLLLVGIAEIIFSLAIEYIRGRNERFILFGENIFI